jgi:predicted phage terminase large subunit-like protein
MTGSYNERLAESFAKRVRNNIMGNEVFREVFPGVDVSKGDGASARWSLNDSPVTNYLATSPGGMATGIGAKIIIIDDIIKNSAEAYSQLTKDNHDEWLNNTMLQRTEGSDWKVIIVMTPWSSDDLAQRVLQTRDTEHVMYPAYTVDSMGRRRFLCPSQLNDKSYDEKIAQMNLDIVEANYMMKPIDIKGRLYKDFNTYKLDELKLKPEELRKSVTDTADKGTDYLVSIVYVVREGIVYVLDLVNSDSAMEVTEQLCAEMHDKYMVKQGLVEANNGGRGFARNLRRLMNWKNVFFKEKMQTSNKEARIMESSGWVQNYVWFPEDYKRRWPAFCKWLFEYNVKGKNIHDDQVDALSYIWYEETGDNVVTQTNYNNEVMHSLHAINESGDTSGFSYW